MMTTAHNSYSWSYFCWCSQLQQCKKYADVKSRFHIISLRLIFCNSMNHLATSWRIQTLKIGSECIRNDVLWIVCFHVVQMLHTQSLSPKYELKWWQKPFITRVHIQRPAQQFNHCQPLLFVCVCLCMCVWLTHPSWSVRFHSTLGVGISGEPSYKTTEAPTARADTSQFHIIQPV